MQTDFYAPFRVFPMKLLKSTQDFDNVILVGVKRRGAEIAELIQRRIEELNGVSLPMMELDITFYRDDLEYVEPGKSNACV